MSTINQLVRKPRAKKSSKVRVVSAPSEGLFRGQSKEYQESVLPKNAKIFGMTAGLPVTLQDPKMPFQLHFC